MEVFNPEDLAAIRGARILLVEDNKINQQVAGNLGAKCLKKLNTLGWPNALGDDVAEIGRLVNKYKFKYALPLAEGILAKLKR